MGGSADVMHANDPAGVDQDVAAKLSPVFTGSAWQAASANLKYVFQDRDRVENAPPGTSLHTILAVQRPLLVEEHGPIQVSRLSVGYGHKVIVENNQFDFNVQFGESVLLLPQLRHI
ncbi:hypothetical protein MFFC18_02880 [Mariniblastus fucicola]|uniref:Uncharacterized protein n=1 Tax=Mariniblastus fucicola TaxID=980251 RepID=A0A5B9P689_9BACT|nr:hypothetical protein MFFC18_02880 [Mariniblastus fucicola]